MPWCSYLPLTVQFAFTGSSKFLDGKFQFDILLLAPRIPFLEFFPSHFPQLIPTMENCKDTNGSPDMQKNKKVIYLVGFMGSGKTTVGALLAEQLDWPFSDLDQIIEESQKTSISEIFETKGGQYFRKLEHAALKGIIHKKPAVVALGGGTVIQAENRKLIYEAEGITIWLEVSFEVLWSRCANLKHRPLARDRTSFRRLFQERLPVYQKSEFCLTTDHLSSRQVVKKILDLPIF